MTETPAPHFKQPLLKTPFHGRARALAQVDSFIPWAGYTTVDVFTTVEQEYFAIRNATTLYDLTPMVKYRVAGPDALPYLNRLVTRDLAKLKPYEVGYFALGTHRLTVSRTGFAGDLGYELWMEPEAAEAVWDALMEAGRSRGIRAIGSQALNIARIEAGFLLPNVDFVSAEHTIRTGRDRSPLELGLGWLVDFNKGHFTGRRALLTERAQGSRRRLVGLDIAGNKPAHNSLLYTDDSSKREIGSVTSATWSPTCKRNIALAIVDAPHFQVGATVWAEIYLNRELVWERRMSRAQIVERPFFAPERRRATPPAEF